MVKTIKCFMCKLERDISLHNYAQDPASAARRWVRTNCPKGLEKCSTALMEDGKRKHNKTHSGKYFFGKILKERY